MDKKLSKFSFELGNFYPFQNEHELTIEQITIIENFHKLYFELLEKKSGLQISWLGHQTGKTPLDLWLYQEMIVKNKPDLIIETGTHWGGSAIFLSTICNILSFGEVLSIDLHPKENLPKSDRLEYLHGSSVDKEIFEKVKYNCQNKKNVMVILDSNHETSHVFEELKLYSELVQLNGYIIVEDTFLNGHPSHKEFGSGPYEAVNLFLRENKNFIIDKSLEKFLFTLNYNGFLKRKS